MRRVACFVLFAAVTSVVLSAQAKPTAGQIEAFVKETLRSANRTSAPQIVVLSPWGMDDAVAVDVIGTNIVRWGEFDGQRKLWPVELCVAARISPTIAWRGTDTSPRRIDAKLRVGFTSDGFGGWKGSYLPSPDNVTPQSANCGATSNPSTDSYDSGFYLVVLRCKGCGEPDWQNELIGMLRSQAPAAFVGGLTPDRVRHFSTFNESTPVIVGPFKDRMAVRTFTGRLPTIIGPLLAKRREAAQSSGNLDSQFQLGSFTFIVRELLAR